MWHSMFDDDTDEDGGLWVWQNMMQLYFMQQNRCAWFFKEVCGSKRKSA